MAGLQTVDSYSTVSYGILDTSATTYYGYGTYFVNALSDAFAYTSTQTTPVPLTLAPLDTLPGYQYYYYGYYYGADYNDNQFSISGSSVASTDYDGFGLVSQYGSFVLWENQVDCSSGTCGQYGQMVVQLYNASQGNTLPCAPAPSSTSSSSSSSTGVALPPPSSSAPSSVSSSTGTAATVLGDPQFMGLRGQSFQVHGMDGEVYSLVRDDAGVRVNARFVFLSAGRCPPLAAISTACWSHPGSYLGEVGVRSAGGARLSVVSGPAAAGFRSVTLDGVAVAVGANVTAGDLSFHYASSHALTLDVGNYAITLHNSDGFVNLAAFAVHQWAELSSQRCHGLLGQTWRAPTKRGSEVRHIEGSVDDYAEANGELFGDDFVEQQ